MWVSLLGNKKVLEKAFRWGLWWEMQRAALREREKGELKGRLSELSSVYTKGRVWVFQLDDMWVIASDDQWESGLGRLWDRR